MKRALYRVKLPDHRPELLKQLELLGRGFFGMMVFNVASDHVAVTASPTVRAKWPTCQRYSPYNSRFTSGYSRKMMLAEMLLNLPTTGAMDSPGGKETNRWT